MSYRHIHGLLWLAFTAALIVLGWQFRDHIEEVLARRGTLTVETRGDSVVLGWRGLIEAPLAARLEEAYRIHAGSAKRFVIAVDSPGGSLQHGRDVIGVIRRMQQTHAVDTLVEDGRTCASMCVAVYLAGAHRTAGPHARFMFHEVSYRDSLSGKVEEVPADSITRATDQFFERYLAPAGLDRAWLARLREAVRGRSVWRTARALVEERTGIVHALVPR
jgi:hypothetical protein